MAREKYGYAETSTLRATVAGPIRSVVNPDMALENGMHMVIGDLVDIGNSEEVYAASLPTEKDPIVFIHSALIAYDTSTTLGQHEMFLRKEAGYPARAYFVYKADRYKIADYCITPIADTVVAKNLVVVNTENGFLKEIAADADISGYGFVGQIEGVEYVSNMTKVKIKVLKNEAVA